MSKVAIVDDQILTDLISEIGGMKSFIEEMKAELKQKTKPYMSSHELMELTGFSSKWVIDNKDKIGFTTVGNQLRFKRKDVEEFMDQNYFKAKKR